jgi:copper chaperone CopZ
MKTILLDVPEISCAHCEHTVTQVLQPLPGVQEVRVDLPAKQVQLRYEEGTLDLEQAYHLLDEEGYPVAAQRTV